MALFTVKRLGISLANLISKFKELNVVHIQKRNLNLHEHHSFKMLDQAGIPVPKFAVANTKSDAGTKAKKLNTNDLVIKAQVLSGGRGKGTFKGGLKGGVRLVNSPEEAERIAGQMIGDFLVTVQTGSKGILCNNVMITERKYLAKEYYLAITMERKFGGPVVICSSQGGVDIETLSKTSPDAISYVPVDIVEGMTQKVGEAVAEKMGLTKQKAAVSDIVQKLYNIFIQKDAVLIEINPFGVDRDGKLWCIDAKLKFDEYAEFRQKTLHSLRDFSQEDQREIQAAKFGLTFIAMEGTIGCLVNGAGLAMATMDIIKHHGGVPANFLDVGGGANVNQVKEAFKIITTDPSVMAVFVNIFGGIMRCDIIAEGIIAAVEELNLNVPIVCRLQGTNVDEARVLLGTSKVKILPVPDLEEASRLAVKLSQIMTFASSSKIQVTFEMPL
uniref:Succinate--CoA ligase [ADP-forming] subunit beta, mitochondrial n=1 Tax=Panstrongylus lignarius TaxID=156445 RepID=A0A224XCN3_9HEMI